MHLKTLRQDLFEINEFRFIAQVMDLPVLKVWPMNRSAERPNSMESVSFVHQIVNSQFRT